MKDTIKINGNQINIETFINLFESTLENLGILLEEIPQKEAEEIAEKFFNNLNEETTS